MTLPAFIPPMLAQPGQPFDSDEFLFEIKWDGTRAMAFVDDKARLINRRQRDISDRYADLIAVLKLVPPGTILDGEIIVMKDGKPDFQSLQKREQARSEFKITQSTRSLPATFTVFDQLYCEGNSIMDSPLLERRELARKTVASLASPRVIMSEGIVGGGIEYFEQSQAMDLEGIIAKRLTSRYLPGKRTDDWIKIKRSQTVACAVVGYLVDDLGGLRSLILASDAGGQLQYVGKVGSGIDQALREKLITLLSARRRDKPIVPVPGPVKGHWVEPGLYCTVRCMERTRDGIMRAPAFVELYER
jgi:DNA ligase D-like protein (predicted ligase)